MANEKETDADSGPNRSSGEPPQAARLSRLQQMVRTTNTQDAERIFIQEATSHDLPNRTETDSTFGQDDTDENIMEWEENAKENPYNWSTMRRAAILLTTVTIILNSTLSSSLPSMAVPYITEDFNVTSSPQKALPIATFLMGYVLGPMTWGSLSEQYGRRIITCITFTLLVVWTLACALAPSWSAFLAFRFLCGVAGGGPAAVGPGIVADIYGNPIERGRAMAWLTAATIWGPLFAPIVSGFCSTSIGWRWTFWTALIYAGLTIPPIFWLPETFAPVLLSRRAAAIREKDPSARIYSATELKGQDLKQLATVVLTRPLRMLTTELIVSSTCLYLALLYSIFYMSFQAFPRIFQGLYGLSPGVTGLCFIPIGLGCFLSVPLLVCYDQFLVRAKKRNAAWSQQEEYRRIPLACIGGPVFVFSLFWLGWAARAEVPFAVPMLAGVPFGVGYTLIFMGLINYLTDAYEDFAASASAASTASRSCMAAVLPLATAPMFDRLGIAGACSLLGGLSALMCVIPVVFIWKGERIRAGSNFCIELKRQKAAKEQRATARKSASIE